MAVGALRSVGFSFAISCCQLVALPANAGLFFVTSANDSGAGSLRQAMTDANASPGPHNISVQLPPNAVIVPGSPLPPVRESMTIDGSPTSNLTIAGSNTFRGFFVANNQLYLINMRLTQMRARGGNGGSSAGSGAGGGGLGAGGAVFVNYAAFLSLTNVSIESSQAIGGNGGISFTVPPANYGSAAGGGGMFGQGGNGSPQGGGGGGGGLFGNGGEGGAGTSPGGNGFGFGAGTGASSPVAAQTGGGGGGGPAGGGGGASVSLALAGTAGIGGVGFLIANTDSGLGGLGTFGGMGFDGSFGFGGNGGKGTASGPNFSFGGGGGGGPGGGGGGGSSGGQGGGGGDFAGGGGAGAEPAGQTVDPATGIGGEGGYGGGGAGGRHPAFVGGASVAGGLGGFGAGNGGASTLNGNGGSGLGGAIFVREGGSVNIVTSTVTGGSVAGGTGPTAGQARGTAFFVDGNGSPVTFLGNGTSVVNDSFSGTGGINKLQVGTLVLNSCQSDYTGPTIINGGVVEIACNEAIGSTAAPIILGNGTLKTNASFVLNHPLNIQILTGLTNAIIDTGPYEITVTQPAVGVGPADFTKVGTGKLAMVAGGGWNGTTTVVSGTLETSGVFFNFPVLVQPGAVLSVQGPPATVPSITALGTVSIGSGLTIQAPAPSTLTTTNGIGTLTIGSAANVTVAGPLSHAGFTNINGMLVLGPGAALISNYVVNPGGTLSGVGNTSDGNVTGGTLSPGINGIGTLVTGSLNISPTSTLRIEIDGFANDRLQVQGPTVLNGTLDLVVLSPAPVGATYLIAIGAQLAGTFNGLAEGALISVPGGKFRIHYDYFQNWVELTSVDLPGAPTNVMATAGPGTATFTFDAPASTGGAPILGYIVRCTFTTFGVVEMTGVASPITLTGLTGGTVHTCTVAATNVVGTGAQSAQVLVTPTVPTYTLTVIRYGTGAGTVTSNIAGIACGPDCSEDYVSGTAVVLTATPSAGSVFRGWSSGCTGTGTCNVTLNAPTTVLALFQPDPAAFPLADFDDDGIPNGVEIAEGRDPYVKDNDVFGNTRLFAMQQYRDFLGREGDAGGIQFYVDLLDAGTLVRANVIENFFNSPEFSGIASPVARLYFATFLRTPDYPGLIFQIDALRAGYTLAQVANNFTLSPEFQATYGALTDSQYVVLLYQNILGRTPVQAEIDFHVARLVSGVTRGEVLVGFSESPEYKAAIANEVYVTMMYVGMLHRVPEAAGLTYWVTYMDGGNSGLALILGFLNAPEYHNRFLP